MRAPTVLDGGPLLLLLPGERAVRQADALLLSRLAEVWRP
jgi:hypothetical protein